MIWPSLESLILKFFQGNGFTASAVSYSMFALASLIAPSIVGWRGPRYLLLPAAAFIFFFNFQGLPCSARASCTFNTSHNFSIQSKVLLPLVLADPTNISQHLPSLCLLCHHWDRWTGSLECPGASPAFSLIFLSQSANLKLDSLPGQFPGLVQRSQHHWQKLWDSLGNGSGLHIIVHNGSGVHSIVRHKTK